MLEVLLLLAEVEGHKLPFDYEKLDSPIKLSCGVTIFEWRGSKPDEKRVEKWCNKAKKAFPTFIKKKFDVEVTTEHFEYSLSLIPFGDSYRDLNDLAYRFNDRTINVYGTVDNPNNWMFVLSDMSHYEFNNTIVHELYHAMVDYYSLKNLQSHAEEEKSALEFERWARR